jgi:hypothetical protein
MYEVSQLWQQNENHKQTEQDINDDTPEHGEPPSGGLRWGKDQSFPNHCAGNLNARLTTLDIPEELGVTLQQAAGKVRAKILIVVSPQDRRNPC